MRLFLLAALLLAVPTAVAQPDRADVVPEAEAAFASALEEYRSGSASEAFRLFTRAGSAFGYHQKTTAALLMAGRAAYAAGQNDLAASTLTGLLREYPNSRYAAEAEALRTRVLRSGGPPAPARPFVLGVVLPLEGDDAILSQALFNGLRLAVDEHNAGGGRPVRMVFRASSEGGGAAQAAVRTLAGLGADAVFGPLYSAEAVAAAEVAEAEGLVLLAPLATEEAVAAGRRFVFQANATFAVRGLAMGAFAAGRLGARRLGTVAEAGTYGAAMADAFEAEAQRLGATIVVSERLPDADAWEAVPTAGFGTAEAVYVPTTGADAAEHAADALRAFEEAGGTALPLGNLEWEALDASVDRASRLRAVFETDFHVEPAAAAAFAARYRPLAGIEPDRLAYIGYDAARYLLARLPAVAAGTPLADALRAAPPQQGLGHRFHFDGGQVNRAVFIKGYRDGEAVLVE